ncbi:DUF5709 domain-containing protein [Streptomyces sp. NPDC058441]|uniref:DUF5709 domain-containing protein n=1 Tax=Streptomyces sp. NPDC058441 TaxID=3346502 RepID=UPI0036685EC2
MRRRAVVVRSRRGRTPGKDPYEFINPRLRPHKQCTYRHVVAVPGCGLSFRGASGCARTAGADGDGLGGTTDADGELLDDEVGGRRAGRVVSEDEGTRPNSSGLDAQDIGLDGGAASAEEAAMHIVGEE